MPIWIETILRSIGLFLGVLFTLRWTNTTPGIFDTIIVISSILLAVFTYYIIN